MDSRSEMERSMLSPEARQGFDELVSLLAREKYGLEGQLKETTFAEMEWFAHQACRLLGRAMDTHLAVQQAENHFQEASCPTCGASGESDDMEGTKVAWCVATHPTKLGFPETDSSHGF